VSASAVTFRDSVERVRLRVSSEVLALGGVASLTIVLAVVTWNTWGDLSSDTGYDLLAGDRVANGEIPYRDFVYYYGPLAPFLSGLATLIGGSGLMPGAILGLILTALILAATYALARRLLSPLGAFLATAITAGVAFIPDNYSYVLPHTFAATLGTLGLLVLLLCIARYAESGNGAFLVAAGLVAGALTLTKPEPMLAGFAAAGVWLALRARSGARLRRELTLFGIPALALPTVVYGAIATVVSPRDLLLENIYPVDMLRAGGDRLIDVRMPLTLSSLVDVTAKLVLYAIGAAALLLVARAITSPRWRRPALIACVSVATVVVVASIAKPDVLRERMYDVWGWLPAGALVAAAVAYRRYRRRDGQWSARSQLELAAVVAFAVVAFSTYGAFVFNGWRPQMAVYYAPLAAIFVASLHLVQLPRSSAGRALGVAWVAFLAAAVVGLTVHRAQDETVTVRGADGALAAPPTDATVYQGAVDAIERNTAPGEPIFAAPLLTGLHVLTGRPNALDVISTLPPALPSTRDQLAAIERLDEAGVRLAVIDTRNWIGYGHSRFGESFDRTIAHWLESHFERLQVVRSTGDDARVLEIWKRREQ
jgi:4-amino-4-deoxy-L-arabinose transferase-like glycosyltransferase